MNDATMEPKENITKEQDFTGKENLPEEFEMVEKLNRHERRKRLKLARMLATKDRLEKEARKKQVNDE